MFKTELDKALILKEMHFSFAVDYLQVFKLLILLLDSAPGKQQKLLGFSGSCFSFLLQPFELLHFSHRFMPVQKEHSIESSQFRLELLQVLDVPRSIHTGKVVKRPKPYK